MRHKHNQLVWGLLLLFFGFVAAFSPPTQESAINEAGECAGEVLCNKEVKSNLKETVLGILTELIGSLPVPGFDSRCRTDDPNLCPKKVKATSSPAKEWTLLSDKFKALNRTFPLDFSVETKFVCCDGYAKEDEDSLCLPVCTSECGENSYCKNPDKCECFEGFRQNPNGQCVSEGEDFRADDPHVCNQKIEVNYATSVLAPIIKHGNLEKIAKLVSSPLLRQNQNKTRTEVHYACCEEYEQKSKGELCKLKRQKPTCAQDCPAHSTCIANGVCQCDEGYASSSDSCQPVCDGEAIEHSRCVRPGERECDNGYFKLPSNDGQGFFCEPHCSKACSTNARCVSPNVCECLPGYITKTLVHSSNSHSDMCVLDQI